MCYIDQKTENLFKYSNEVKRRFCFISSVTHNSKTSIHKPKRIKAMPKVTVYKFSITFKSISKTLKIICKVELNSSQSSVRNNVCGTQFRDPFLN